MRKKMGLPCNGASFHGTPRDSDNSGFYTAVKTKMVFQTCWEDTLFYCWIITAFFLDLFLVFLGSKYLWGLSDSFAIPAAPGLKCPSCETPPKFRRPRLNLACWKTRGSRGVFSALRPLQKNRSSRSPTRWCPSSLAKLVYKSHNYGLWQI